MRCVSPVAHGSYSDCAGLSCSVQAPSLVKINEKGKFLFLVQCIVVPSVVLDELSEEHNSLVTDSPVGHDTSDRAMWQVTHRWVIPHRNEDFKKWCCSERVKYDTKLTFFRHASHRTTFVFSSFLAKGDALKERRCLHNAFLLFL